MTKHLCTILIGAIIATAARSAHATDFKDIFNNEKIGQIISNIGQTVANATATTKFTVDDLVGTWKYKSPGISFRSESTLANISGAAAATAIEEKLAPYYKRSRMTKVTLTVDKSHNFAIKTTYGTFKGTIEKSSQDDMLVFKFNVLGAVPIGHVNAMATKSDNQLNITFDASRLINILKRLPKVASNTSFSTVASILDNYHRLSHDTQINVVRIAHQKPARRPHTHTLTLFCRISQE